MPATFWCALALLAQGPTTTKPEDPIAAPPANLAADGFYKKCVYFRGIPILGSEKVEDKALRVIVATFDKMLSKVPDKVFAKMVEGKVHYSIIAFEEGQTDLPEYRHMKNDPNMDWDKRARGLGGRVTSGGEENILEYPEDRYKGESIFIHEFAHTLASHGFSRTDPEFSKELTAAYKKAMEEKLWPQTYAATNEHEYWAEGVQSYFDCNRSATPPNGIHNEICDREGLKKYDPRLFDLLDRTFGGNPWRYEGKYNSTKK